MSETEEKTAIEIEEMHKRTITLADGRYMIFYEFGDEAGRADDREPEQTKRPTNTEANV